MISLLNVHQIYLICRDTAGQETHAALTHAFYRGSDAAILVYDVTNAKSFEDLPMWLMNLRMMTQKDIPVILFANKVDLDSWQVKFSKATEWANANGILQVLETSAKEDVRVELGLSSLVKAAMENFVTPLPFPEPIVGPGQSSRSKSSCPNCSQ